MFFLFSVLSFSIFGDEEETKKEKAFPPEQPLTELGIETIHKPDYCELKTKTGDLLTMHYRGRLMETDDEFDSSYERDQPFQFRLGQGMVIKGWDEGLQSMCIGEKRRLYIPASLGYGKRGVPPSIPANSDLVFDVELVTFSDVPQRPRKSAAERVKRKKKAAKAKRMQEEMKGDQQPDGSYVVNYASGPDKDDDDDL
ncbi:putative FK506-binding protein 2 [Blattamonas nauphoetae]|uniref:peptidylprolyl isomerase n=1 Tax=Blattamonas nauphoetae TaxID=2049346 RepID=A0ABQ9YCL0_9EUKA|nr:putative FK506-binding protein 2 [Blattamonas nauphoetae]